MTGPLKCNRIGKVIRDQDGKVFASASAAARDVGCTPAAVLLQLSGRNKTCRGWTFSYVEDKA